MRHCDFVLQQVLTKLPESSGNIFIIHSNLHLLQAIYLHETDDFCLYTDAVSEPYLQQHFSGTLIKIPDTFKFTLSELYPLKAACFGRSKTQNIYLGNKHNWWSTYIVNNLPCKQLCLLDDGLSTYGLSEQLYFEKNWFKKILKKGVNLVFKLFSMHYFHEANLSEVDRYCKAFYFFSKLKPVSTKVEMVQYSAKEFKEKTFFVTQALSEKEVFVASYLLSQKVVECPTDYNVEQYFLHPRVSGKASNPPLEVLLLDAEKVHTGLSSVALFLIFMGFDGEFLFEDKQQAKPVIDKLIQYKA